MGTFLKNNIIVILIAIILHFLTLFKYPMFGDDFQRGVLESRALTVEQEQYSLFSIGSSKIEYSSIEPVLSLNIGSQVIPLLYQVREGGLSYMLFKVMKLVSSPLWTIRIYKFTLFLVYVWLALILLEKFKVTATLDKIIILCSPISLLAFGPYFADQLMLVLFMLFLVADMEKWAWWKIFVIGMLGLYTRSTFLFFLIAYLPVGKGRYFKKFFLPIVACSVLGFLFVTSIMPGQVAYEISGDMKPFKSLSYFKVYLKDLFYLFTNELEYLQYFLRWKHSQLFFSLVLFVGLMKWVPTLTRLKYIRKDYFISILTFVLLISLLTYEFSSPVDYFIPLSFFISIYSIVNINYFKKHGQGITLALKCLLLAPTLIFCINYYQQGPHLSINGAAMNSLSSKLVSRDVKQVITANKYLHGQIDYFTQGKVKTIYDENLSYFENGITLQSCSFTWGEQSYSGEDQGCVLDKKKILYDIEVNKPRKYIFSLMHN